MWFVTNTQSTTTRSYCVSCTRAGLVRVPRAALQRGMLPLRAVGERAFSVSRELDSILPKVYDIYLANMAARQSSDQHGPGHRRAAILCRPDLNIEKLDLMYEQERVAEKARAEMDDAEPSDLDLCSALEQSATGAASYMPAS